MQSSNFLLFEISKASTRLIKPGMSEAKIETEFKRPSLLLALAPALALIALLTVNVWLYGPDATYGPNQIALILAAAVAGVGGLTLGVPIKRMLDGFQSSLGAALPAVLILLLIGALSGTWMISGVVPAMIYYGLECARAELLFSGECGDLLDRFNGHRKFLVDSRDRGGGAAWGLEQRLELPIPMTAGAIISGAYFGDKLSPLSDTTNLAAAMAGTDLVTHIRYMLWTTVPSILITLGLFFYLGNDAGKRRSKSGGRGGSPSFVGGSVLYHALVVFGPRSGVGDGIHEGRCYGRAAGWYPAWSALTAVVAQPEISSILL